MLFQISLKAPELLQNPTILSLSNSFSCEQEMERKRKLTFGKTKVLLLPPAPPPPPPGRQPFSHPLLHLLQPLHFFIENKTALYVLGAQKFDTSSPVHEKTGLEMALPIENILTARSKK